LLDHQVLLFLYLNGIKLEIDPDELIDFILSVVENNVPKEEIVDYFRCCRQCGSEKILYVLMNFHSFNMLGTRKRADSTVFC